MDSVAFDFTCQLAFLKVSDEFVEIDLVDSFARQEFFLRGNAIRFLIFS
jgi:hypothetical protein